MEAQPSFDLINLGAFKLLDLLIRPPILSHQFFIYPEQFLELLQVFFVVFTKNKVRFGIHPNLGL